MTIVLKVYFGNKKKYLRFLDEDYDWAVKELETYRKSGFLSELLFENRHSK